MPVIFNSVSTYVESVGRRRDIRHWNELDSIEVIQTGPTATVEDWIPKVGAQNRFYSNLFFDSAQVVSEAANVTSLRCTYVGKFYSMGKPSIGSSTHQGEISWTSYAGINVFIQTQGVQAGGPSGTAMGSGGGLIPAVPPVYAVEFVSFTWLARFIVTTAIYKTLTRNPDIAIGSGGGSWTITSEFRTGRVSNSSGIGMIAGILTFPTILLDSSVQPLNNGWYEVSSTWGPQAEIQTILTNIPTPPNNLGVLTLGFPS